MAFRAPRPWYSLQKTPSLVSASACVWDRALLASHTCPRRRARPRYRWGTLITTPRSRCLRYPIRKSGHTTMICVIPMRRPSRAHLAYLDASLLPIMRRQKGCTRRRVIFPSVCFPGARLQCIDPWEPVDSDRSFPVSMYISGLYALPDSQPWQEKSVHGTTRRIFPSDTYPWMCTPRRGASDHPVR